MAFRNNFMKMTSRTLFYFFIFFIPVSVFGQRFQGNSNLNASFRAGTAIGGGIEYEKLLKNNFSFFLGATYLNMTDNVNISDQQINARFNDFLGELGSRYVLYEYSKILPYVGISAFAGYEKFINKKDIPLTVVYNREDGLTYGAGAELGAEYNFGKLSFFGSLQGKYFFSQEIISVLGNIGIKYYLF